MRRLFLPLLLSASLAGQQPDDARPAVEDACIQADPIELDRWIELLGAEGRTSALEHYLLGLALWQRHTLLNGGPAGRDEATAQALTRAAELLAQTAAAGPELQAEATAALGLCNSARMMAAGGAAMPLYLATTAAVEEALAAHPDHPGLVFVDANLAGSGGGSNTERMERLVQGSDRARQLATELLDEDPDHFWALQTLAMLARNDLFMPRPRGDRAARITERILEARPDHRMARDFLQPFGRVRHPAPQSAWGALEWQTLSEDARGDGRPGLADGVGWDQARTPTHHWFRLRLAEAPPTDSLGMNLVLDLDPRDPGTAWWGAHSDFSFDRLVTVWVAKDPMGQWRGAVGTADGDDAPGGAMTTGGDGTVEFAVDPGARALLLGVPREVFGDRSTVRALAAVGGHSMWNDDLPDGDPLILEVNR